MVDKSHGLRCTSSALTGLAILEAGLMESQMRRHGSLVLEFIGGEANHIKASVNTFIVMREEVVHRMQTCWPGFLQSAAGLLLASGWLICPPQLSLHVNAAALFCTALGLQPVLGPYGNGSSVPVSPWLHTQRPVCASKVSRAHLEAYASCLVPYLRPRTIMIMVALAQRVPLDRPSVADLLMQPRGHTS